MKLTEKLKLQSVAHRKHHINRLGKDVTFLYEDYRLELGVSFAPIARTQDMIPIYNFGYGLDIEEWDNEYECFNTLSRRKYNSNDGKESKKYFSCTESRKVVRKFVNKYVEQTLQKYEFPIIVRGPLTKFKQTSKRYTDIDEIIKSFGYNRVIVTLQELEDMDSFIPFEEDSEAYTDEYWFYSKEKINKNYLTYLLAY